MLTPNGGVFGRNPTFNNVTVERNLTANGSNFTAGAVRITAHYITLVAPAS